MQKSSRILKTVLPVAVVALILALGGWYLVQGRDEAEPPATVPVALGSVERSVLAVGTLMPAVMVDVGAQVSGQLTRLEVELGQTVKRGDLIAEIDSAPQRIVLRNAEERLNVVRAQRRARAATLAQARLELRRQTELLKDDATSRAQFELAEAAVLAGEAEVEALDAQIAEATTTVGTARVNLGYTEIRAPVDGTVVAIVARRGQTVNANQTTPTIIRLANLDAMIVQARISEADVTKVRPGQEAYFTVLGDPDRRFQATLRSIELAPESFAETSQARSAAASPTTRAVYYNGLLEVPNEEGRLRIAMTAQVSIVLERASDVPTVPASVLGRRAADGSHALRVLLDGGALECRTVTVGVNNNAVSEVRSGLKVGERVVVPGPGAAPAAECPPSGAKG